jgi:apolipoprotein N-acyltransferase
MARHFFRVHQATMNQSKIILAIVSGIALTAGFPGVGFSYAAWIAFVFLFYAMQDLSARQSFVLGLVAGFVHFATLLYWLVGTMHVYGYLPIWLSTMVFLLLVFYLALYMAVFLWLVRLFCFKPLVLMILAPALWVCLEYLRTFLITGFPWGLLGYTQYKHLYLMQIADILGVYGMSFVIVFANVVIYFLLLYVKGLCWQAEKVSKKLLVVSISLLVAVSVLIWSYGHIRLKFVDKMIAESETIKIALIQGNIEQTDKWDLEYRKDIISTYFRLSDQAMAYHPDLIVWPETATPFYFKYNKKLTDMVLQGIRSADTYFLIGSPSVEFAKPEDRYYNSAYLITPQGEIAGRYDKTHLVPFGEYVPLKKWLPFINHMVAQVGGFKSGPAGHTLKWGPADIGVQICYEVIFPQLASQMVANNSEIIVNITNDAWFGETGAPYQHFSMAVFRAVENRRSLVRAANTGISGFIDPAGRVLEASSLFKEDAMVRSVPVIRNYISFYTRYGDLPVLMSFIATMIIVMIGFKKGRR